MLPSCPHLLEWVTSSLVSWSVLQRSLATSARVAVRTATRPPQHMLSLSRRRVPTDVKEVELMRRKPAQLPEHKRLNVAILGVPNSGKSTLVNRLLQWPVCSVSSKVHTTQTATRTALTVDDTQLVLEDTPGLVTEAERRRHGLSDHILQDPGVALRRADLVCVLHDVSDARSAAGLSPKVQRLLFAEPHKPAVLVLTKVDALVMKRRLLDMARRLTEGYVNGEQMQHRHKQRPQRPDAELLLGHKQPETPPPPVSRLEKFRNEGVEFVDGFMYREMDPASAVDPEHRQLVLSGGCDRLTEQQLWTLARSWRSWPLFRRVFMTSSVEDRGVVELCQFLLSAARPAGWRYSCELVTDRQPRKLAADIVRATLLEQLPAEVPYSVSVLVNRWEPSAGGEVLGAEVRLQCQKLPHSRIILKRIRAIATAAEQALRNAFRAEITLRLDVQPTPENWGKRLQAAA